MVAAVMFSVALPVFVSVTVCEALLPTLTLPNDTEDGLIESCGWVAAPEPLRPIVSGDPGALLVTETVPVALPLAVGANVTLNELLAPGFKVAAVKPLSAKPAPEMLAAETDTGAVPELVSFTDADALLPIRMLPKLRLVGLAESAPCVPVPLSATERVGFVAFVAIVTLPAALPAAVGAKVAVNEACAPAAMICPALRPLALKPAPEVLKELIVTGPAPEFVSMMVCWLLLPTTTPLKL